VAGRVGDHRRQPVAVGGLDLRLSGQLIAGRGDPVGQLVADPLEAAEVEGARRARPGGDAVVDLDPAECLAEEAPELALEPADLASQLGPRKTLVDDDVEPLEAPSFEQFPHALTRV
jgi:hypothetical protein